MSQACKVDEEAIWESSELQTPSWKNFMKSVLEVAAQGYLHGMTENDTPTRDYLSQLDGKYSQKCASAATKNDLSRAVNNSDASESSFGVTKHLMRCWRNLYVET